MDYIGLILLPLVFSLYASHKVKSTFAKYSKVRSAKGISADEVARMLLRNSGITDVVVSRISGKLTDHYDPRSKTIRLSDSVYGSTSLSAIGVAAHETGHAVQHNVGYGPLNLRTAFVPVANIGSQAAMPLIIAGMVFGNVFVHVGIILFTAAVLFQIITLPVEFNASSRALEMVESAGVLSYDETDYSRKVLNAAALTYVAAAAAALGQLIRLILIFGGGRRN